MPAQTFRNRARELVRLEELWAGEAARFVTVSGRRRVGKSRLLTEFMRPRQHVYLTGTRETAVAQLRDATDALRRLTKDPLLAAQDLTNWDAVLAYCTPRARAERFALVLDEFSLFSDAAPGLESLLQRWWDRDGQHSRIVLVIADSSLAFMSRLISGDQPLFGRSTHRLDLQPLDYFDAASFFSAYSPEDRMRAFGIFGGMPAYLADIDASVSLRENVARLIFTSTSALREEPDYLFAQERSIREPRSYRTVLRAIAEGHTQPNDIAQAAGYRSPQEISEVLKRLRELALVERVVPVGSPPAGRISRYVVTDPFLTFWFRFVAPAQSMIAEDAGRFVVDDLFARDCLAVDEFVSRPQGPWERSCAAYLMRAQRSGAPADIRFDTLGCWWQSRAPDQSAEIDVVGLRKDRPSLVASAKWKGDYMKPADLDDLRAAARLLSRTPTREMLFSRSGFDANLIARAQAESVHLVDVESMYAAELATSPSIQ